MTDETQLYNEFDIEDEDNNNNNVIIDRPRLTNTTSQQRPQTEKKITKKEFKKYRGLVAKRLSSKQRMSFEELISRNIHGGLQDELNEKRPMEKSKKILQLNRRLSHRPHPSDIQNDDELPLDLKKADSEYQKIYKYRDDEYRDDEYSDYSSDGPPPPRNRTTSDPNPMDKINNNNIIKSLNINKKLTSIDNPLDWKFGQRSSTKELQIRGIIPEQYADVVHGDKSLEDAKKEWQLYKKKSSIKIKNKINLKFRPTKQDLRDRGIIYEENEMKELKKTKKKHIKSLSMKIGQRSSTNELQIRGIIPAQYTNVVHGNKSLEDAKKEWKLYKKKSSIKIKNKINLKFRPTKQDLRDRDIFYEENEMKELKKTKKKHIKSLSNKFGQRLSTNELQIRGIIPAQYTSCMGYNCYF
eukprot:286768_1